jgi:hypothetical protein
MPAAVEQRIRRQWPGESLLPCSVVHVTVENESGTTCLGQPCQQQLRVLLRGRISNLAAAECFT